MSTYSRLVTATRHLMYADMEIERVADKLDPQTIERLKAVLADVNEARNTAAELLRAGKVSGDA